MQIYPAIDIKDGKAVRLVQGKFDKATVFDSDPVNAAKRWVENNADYIHIVDLDGARYGKSFITEIINKIKKNHPDISIQTGGGIRRMEDIDERISAGASRVIIGTAAVENPELVKASAEKYPGKIAVGIDALSGFAAVKGWEEISNVTALELCLKMKDTGIKDIIYTDISKDGMMNGPNIASTKEIVEKTGLNIIASGGVSSMEDLENIQKTGASGVIIGKALYSGALKLDDIIERFGG